MSDEISAGGTSVTEGASSSETSNSSAGESAQTPSAPIETASPLSMADKIAKFKGADKGGSAKAAPGPKVGASQALNTSTGVEGAPGAQPPSTGAAPAQAPIALGPDGKPLPAAFQPSFKFKFMGEEKEIPEAFRAIIKDAETEKMVRELHEKAMGLDAIKPKFQEQSQQFNALTKGLSSLDQYLVRDQKTQMPKDLGKFLDAFKLTDKDIFAYAKDRLEYMQLPDDQRQRIEAEQEARTQAMQLQQENATLREQAETVQAQQMDAQLRGLMQHPSISPVVAKHPGGESGFYRDVATHAWYLEMANPGQKLTPEQAVLSYIQARGLGASPVQNATAQVGQPGAEAPAPVSAAPAPVTETRAPTLPNVPSQGTSPAKKMVGSLKDLRKIRDQKVAESQL